VKTATGLIVMAVGAVFAFAVTLHVSFLSLQALGWILILLGLAGLIVPRRGYGWLRRLLVTGRGSDGGPTARFERRDAPPYLMINPAGPDLSQAVPDEELVAEYFPE
jgi:hypothetical protein